MSKDKPQSPKRRKYSIESVRITPEENATVKNVMARLMGKDQPSTKETEEDTLGSLPAQGNQTTQTRLSAQTTQSSSTAQGTLSAQGSASAQSRESTQSRVPAQGRADAQGRRSTQSSRTAQSKIAPSRDFMKSANSIVRDAIRHGLFRGKSKQLYDYLYSKTRGAVVPSLSVRLRRSELMKGSHIGSTHTLRDNLLHLRSVGLTSWQAIQGEQDGNIYYVHLPEEAKLPFDLDGNPVQSTSTDHSDHPEQKPLRLPSADSAQSAQSVSQTNQTTSADGNTFSLRLSQTTDDEPAALSDFLRVFHQAAVEVTGSEPSQREADRWRELAEVITAEAKVAAARTTSVSSFPAFLAAHLRRRFLKQPAARAGLTPGEGKPAQANTTPEAQSTQVSNASTVEVEESIEMFSDLVKDGSYNLDQLAEQFSQGFSAEEWQRILSGIEKRLAESGTTEQ